MGGYLSTSEPHAGEDGFYYGWLPDPPDPRDHIYRLTLSQTKKANQITRFDMREGCPPVYNQGSIGSCTANAVNGAFEFDLKKQGLHDFVPSRLFVYYNERVMEGTQNWDAGAYLRDGVKTLNREGVCHETDWPYNVSRYRHRPPSSCYMSARGCKAIKYARVSQKVEDLKAALVHEKTPICFGFRVHKSFHGREVSRTGRMPMPGSASTDPVIGGHAVQVVGFIESERVFIIRNSWGTWWGDKGYFYMPYDFISDPKECSDFWLIQYVEERSDDEKDGKDKKEKEAEREKEKEKNEKEAEPDVVSFKSQMTRRG